MHFISLPLFSLWFPSSKYSLSFFPVSFLPLFSLCLSYYLCLLYSIPLSLPLYPQPSLSILLSPSILFVFLTLFLFFTLSLYLSPSFHLYLSFLLSPSILSLSSLLSHFISFPLFYSLPWCIRNECRKNSRLMWLLRLFQDYSEATAKGWKKVHQWKMILQQSKKQKMKQETYREKRKIMVLVWC